MRAILTGLAIIGMGLNTYANQPPIPSNALESISVIGNMDNDLGNHMAKEKLVRLYLFKNSRIKKELAFRTKANKAKLT